MKRIAIAIALAACGSKRSAGPTCDDLRPMVDRMYAATMQELGPGMKPDERKRAADVAAQVTPAMKEAIVEACRADRWPGDVVTCMAAASSEGALDGCEARLPAEARAHVEAAMSEVVTRIQPPEGVAEDDDDQLGIGESGLPECDAYATAMQAYLDCDEIAAPVKASARAGLADLRRTWPALRDPATGAPAKQAAAAACVAAREELEKSAQAMGCTRDAGAASTDCTVLGPMIRAILAEQRRDVRALAPPLERSLVETCTSGRWSASAVACLDRARTAAALVACEAQLTPDQADALAHAMESATR